MLHRCTKENEQQIYAYLNQQPIINLFMLGDLYHYGFDHDFQEFYIDLQDQQIQAIYMRYYHNLLVQSYTHQMDNEFMKEYIAKHQITTLQGPTALLKSYTGAVKEKSDCYFATLTKVNLQVNFPVQLLGIDDLEKVKTLQEICFEREMNHIEEMKQNILDHTGRIMGIFVDGQLVSCCQTSAEANGQAMLVGVCTHPQYRGRGYGKACVTTVCQKLLDEKMQPSLFYVNPIAAQIYHQIGFKDIGEWSVYRI